MSSLHPYNPAPFFATYGIHTHARAALTTDDLVIYVEDEPERRIPLDDLPADELERLGDVLNWQNTQQ